MVYCLQATPDSFSAGVRVGGDGSREAKVGANVLTA